MAGKSWHSGSGEQALCGFRADELGRVASWVNMAVQHGHGETPETFDTYQVKTAERRFYSIAPLSDGAAVQHRTSAFYAGGDVSSGSGLKTRHNLPRDLDFASYRCWKNYFAE
jgi:hypothetical protein